MPFTLTNQRRNTGNNSRILNNIAMRKDQIRARAEAQLARYPKNSGHARVLRARLGIADDAPAPAPAPVVEEPVAEVVEEKPKKKRTTRKKKSEQ